MEDFVHVESPKDSDPPITDITKSHLREEEQDYDLDFLKLHPFVRQTILDKIYGCVVGSALGDTIGLYTEFLPKQACESIYTKRKFQLVEPATEWYPDTHRSRPNDTLPDDEMLIGRRSI